MSNDINFADAILLSTENWFAHCIRGPGDLNSDGYDDFMVSHAQEGISRIYAKNGLVLGFLGTAVLGGTYEDEEVADFLIAGENGQRLGMAMSLAGSIAFDDVWIGMGSCNICHQCDTHFQMTSLCCFQGLRSINFLNVSRKEQWWCITVPIVPTIEIEALYSLLH